MLSILTAELANFDSYFQQHHYPESLVKIQSSLGRVKVKPRTQNEREGVHVLLPELLNRVLALGPKISATEAERLYEQAYAVAMTWIDFSHRDGIWASLTTLVLVMGEHAYNKHLGAAQPAAIMVSYQEALNQFHDVVRWRHYFAEAIAPSLKELHTQQKEIRALKTALNKAMQAIGESKTPNCVVSPPLSIKAYGDALVQYGEQLAELLVTLLNAGKRGLLPFEQLKPLRDRSEQVHKQQERLALSVEIIHDAASSSSAMQQRQMMHKCFEKFAKAHAACQALENGLTRSFERLVDTMGQDIKTYQRLLNYYNLALWLMPATDERQQVTLQTVDKIHAVVIFQLLSEYWLTKIEQAVENSNGLTWPKVPDLFSLSFQVYLTDHRYSDLTADIAQTFPQVSSFNPAQDFGRKLAPFQVLTTIDTLLQRIAPYLARLEAHGLFSSVIQFYEAVQEKLERYLDEAKQPFVHQTFLRLQHMLTTQVRSLLTREQAYVAAKKDSIAPLPNAAFGIWQKCRDVLKVQRDLALPNPVPDAIQKTQASYVEEFKKVVGLVVGDIEQMLGSAPDYCFGAGGSLGRGDASPRSDIECGLWVAKKDVASVMYFARMQPLFILTLTAVGETPLGQDDIFPAGFHLDSGSNPWTEHRLWDTPKNMAASFNPYYLDNRAGAQGAIAYSMVTPTFVYGNSETLLHEYCAKMQEKLTEPDATTHRPLHQQWALERMAQHQHDYVRELGTSQVDRVAIKSRYIQLLTFMAMDLALYYRVPQTHPLDAMTELAERGIISQAFKNIFHTLFTQLSALRMQSHLDHRHQCDGLALASLSWEAKQILRDTDQLLLQPFHAAQTAACERLEVTSWSEYLGGDDVITPCLQEMHWRFVINAISTETSNHSPQPGSVIIEGIDTPARQLQDEVALQLIDDSSGYFDKEKAKQCQLPGRRAVIAIRCYGHIIAYAKPYPEFPGYEQATARLADTLCPGGSVRQELFQFTVALKTTASAQKEQILRYPVLISQAVEGEMVKTVLQRDATDAVVDIHPYYFAQSFLWTQTTNQEDHTGSNLFLIAIPNSKGDGKMGSNEKTHNPWLRFMAVDSDHAFVAPLKEYSVGEKLAHSVAFQSLPMETNVKSFVLCHDLMNQPLDEPAVMDFVALDIDTLLQQCLSQLARYNQRCLQLFGKNQLEALYQENNEEQSRSFLLSGFGEAGIRTLYNKLTLTQHLLQDALARHQRHPDIPLPTPLEILHYVEPLLGQRYAQAFQAETTLLTRFAHIGQHAYLNLYAKKSPTTSRATRGEMALAMQSQHSVQQTLSTMQIGNTQDYKGAEAEIINEPDYIDKHDSVMLATLTLEARSLQTLREKLYDATLPAQEKQAVLRQIANLVPSLKIAWLNGSPNMPGLDFGRMVTVKKRGWQIITVPDEESQRSVLRALSGVIFIKLRLRNCSARTVSILEKLVLPSKTLSQSSLQVLDISGCQALTEDALVMLARTCPNLEKLNISRLPRWQSLAVITYEGTLFNRTRTTQSLVFEKLERLIITDCRQLEEINLTVPKLRSLVLSRCEKLTKINVQGQVFLLDVSGWAMLTDERLQSIVKSCQGVKQLNLVGCQAISFREYKERELALVYKSEAGLSALDWFEAVRLGYWAIAEFILEQNPLVINARNTDDHTTLLMRMAKIGKKEAVRWLCAHDALLEEKDKDGRTVLHWAAGNGHTNTVQYLVAEANVDISAEDNNGNTAFCLAAWQGHFEVMAYLYQQGADINHKRKLDDKTPLMLVAGYGKTKVVRWLCEHGAFCEEKDKDGRTAFHLAAGCGHLETIQYLVAEAKVDMSSEDNEGNTAFILAARQGQLKVRTYLQQHGADINQKQIRLFPLELEPISQNETKKTKIECEIKKLVDLRAKACKDRQITAKLIENSKAFSNDLEISQLVSVLRLKDKEEEQGICTIDKKLLMLAARSGKTDIVRWLCEHGALLEEKDKQGSTALHWAASYGNLETVQDLVEKVKVDISAEDNNNGDTAFGLAAWQGHLEVMIYLHQQGADVNHKRKVDDITPLMIAAISGETDVVRWLYEHGALPEEKDKQGSTALHWAASCGNLETVQYLVAEVKVDISLEDNDGDNAFSIAAWQGHLEVMLYLQQQGADINLKPKVGNRTHLMVAASKGKTEAVRWLCEHGALPEEKDKQDFTALHWTAAHGHVETVQYLVEEAKVDMSAEDNNGNTAFSIAAWQGHLEVMLYLQQHGADITLKPQVDNRTHLMAAAEGDNIEVVRWLCEHGVLPEAKDKDGRTALHLAAGCGYLEIVQYLIEEAKVVLSAEDNNGNTAFSIAAWEGQLAVMVYLHQHGANVNQKHKFGNLTPLKLAASNGKTAAVRWLCEHGASLKEKDNGWSIEKDSTVLHWAARGGHLETVQYLVAEAKIDMSVEDDTHDTAFSLATLQRHLAVMAYLHQRGADINHKREGDGQIPLIGAARDGATEVVRWLCEHGALVEGKNKWGYTALHLAVRNGHLETVQYLVEEAKVDMSAENNDGDTTFSLAAQQGHLAVMAYLHQQGANINHKREFNNKTPLMAAAENGKTEAVRWLCEHGALVGEKSKEGSTALHLAAECGSRDVAKILLEYGADILQENVAGKTALGIAKERNNTNFVKLLESTLSALDKGKNADAVSQPSFTAENYQQHGLFSQPTFETPNTLVVSPTAAAKEQARRKSADRSEDDFKNNAVGNNGLMLMPECYFNVLPDTSQLFIFSYLDYVSRTKTSTVCQLWRSLAQYNDLNFGIAPLLTSQEIAGALVYLNEQREQCSVLVENNLTSDWEAVRIKPLLDHASHLIVTFSNKTTTEEKQFVLSAHEVKRYAENYSAQCQEREHARLLRLTEYEAVAIAYTLKINAAEKIELDESVKSTKIPSLISAGKEVAKQLDARHVVLIFIAKLEELANLTWSYGQYYNLAFMHQGTTFAIYLQMIAREYGNKSLRDSDVARRVFIHCDDIPRAIDDTRRSINRAVLSHYSRKIEVQQMNNYITAFNSFLSIVKQHMYKLAVNEQFERNVFNYKGF
jgi:ankyrin repeat protein